MQHKAEIIIPIFLGVCLLSLQNCADTATLAQSRCSTTSPPFETAGTPHPQPCAFVSQCILPLPLEYIPLSFLM